MRVGVLEQRKWIDIAYRHRYNIVLYILMTIDFLYTYIGIRYIGVITEANPIMVWLFELDFLPALAVRILIMTVLVGLVCYIREIEHKWYSKLMGIVLIGNIFAIFLHLNWLIYTLKYFN